MDLDNRHPTTRDIAKHFRYDHLPPALQAISKPCHDLAADMIAALPDGHQLATGLQHLLEAKDAFVRANLP